MVILKFGDLSEVLPYGAKDIKVYPRALQLTAMS